MLRRIQLILFLLFVQQFCFAQPTSISNTAKDQLYIHTDKDYYLKGATIYYKIYLSDQSNILGSSKSEVVYIDLISDQGQIEQAKTVKTIDGVGIGSFDLSSFGEGGTYALRAYTNHMRNFHPHDFFRKLLLVENGKSISEENVKSNNQLTELPEATEATKHIDATISDEILTTTINRLDNPSDFSLHLIQGSNTILEKELSTNKLTEFSFKLEELPTGIIRCILVNREKKIISERYIFNHLGINNFNVDFQFDQEQYNKRSLVNLSFDIYDDEGESMPGNYSISVVDRYLNKEILNNTNIQSNSLLSNGFGLPTVHPTVFITEDAEVNTELIDQYMNMNSTTINELVTSKTLQYKPETKYSIKGKIHSIKNIDKGVSASGEMNVLQPILDTYSFDSDENGLFSIQTNIPSDVVDAFFKLGDIKKNKSEASNIKVNKKLGLTIFDQVKPEVDDYTIQLINNMSVRKKEDVDKVTVDRYERILQLENSSDIAITDTITEISITAKPIDQFIKESKRSMLYTRPNTRIIVQDIPQVNEYDDLYDVLRGRVPGIEITRAQNGEDSRLSVILRGRTTGLSSVSPSDAAKFLINGNFASASTAESIPPSQIAFIDVISSLNQLTQYGEQGVNGIINIYLKEQIGGELRKLPINNSDLILKNINGFHVSKPFNYPDYSYESIEHSKFDSRTTLYWNPYLIVDDSGETTIQFYTGDRNTIYDVIIEGISDNGMPVQSTSTFSVINE